MCVTAWWLDYLCKGWMQARIAGFGLGVLSMFLVCSFVAVVIPLSIFLSFDSLPKSTVDETMCNCDCWDGLFKVRLGEKKNEENPNSPISLPSTLPHRAHMGGDSTSTVPSTGIWSGGPTSSFWCVCGCQFTPKTKHRTKRKPKIRIWLGPWVLPDHHGGGREAAPGLGAERTVN